MYGKRGIINRALAMWCVVSVCAPGLSAVAQAGADTDAAQAPGPGPGKKVRSGAAAWPGPTFREFSGTNQGDPARSIYRNAASWSRTHGFGDASITWRDLEPWAPTRANLAAGRYVWREDHLEKFGREVLAFHAKKAEVLPILCYGAGWSAGEMVRSPGAPGPVGDAHVEDWKNYVRRVVRFLRREPYQVEYFQVWNEADPVAGYYENPEGSFKDGLPQPTMDSYMTNVHLPAAAIIHALGGKVVWGGWPTCDACGSLADYVALLDAYDAWESVDVLDVHYRAAYGAWRFLRRAADARGYGNLKIWQTEIGFHKDVDFIARFYTPAFYWALTHGYDEPHDYKIMYYAEQSPDEPDAFGYHKCLYSGDELFWHGVNLQTLGDLFDGGPVAVYTYVANDRCLAPGPDEASSLEAFLVEGRRIVCAVHLRADDVAEPESETITLTFSDFTKPAQISSITRVDMSGYTTPAPKVSYDPDLQVTVPVRDDPASPVRRTWNYSYDMYHFYVVVTPH